MCYYVYILYSKSLDSFYKGQTNDLSDRIYRHNLKRENATKNGAPWALIWSTSKNSRSDAVVLERKLKNLSRKRLLAFIEKYSEGLEEGPDVPLLRKSGC